MSTITVTIVTVEAMRVVSLRGTVPSYADEGVLWSQFLPLLALQGISPIGPGGVIEHDGEFRESEVDESVWLPVAAGIEAEAPLEIIDLPTRQVVQARVEGPYELINEAHHRIQQFVREQGLQLAEGATDEGANGKAFNIYLSDPSTVATPADNITLVCLPLA